MNLITRIMFGMLSLLLVSSCTNMKLSQEQKQAQRLCKMTCEKRAKACNKVCVNNCPHCCAQSTMTTRQHFLHYVQEETVKGGIIARNLNSYRDPLQCRKTTCDCWTDYQVCKQSCVGVIQKRLQAPPIC